MIATSHVIGTNEISIAWDRARPCKTIIIVPICRILRLFLIPAQVVSGAIVLVDTHGCEQDEYID